MKLIKDRELYIILLYLVKLTKDINRVYNKHHEGNFESELYNNQIKNVSSLAKEILPYDYFQQYKKICESHTRFLLQEYLKNNEVRK